jgi:hypothetical protein
MNVERLEPLGECLDAALETLQGLSGWTEAQVLSFAVAQLVSRLSSNPATDPAVASACRSYIATMLTLLESAEPKKEPHA